MHASGGRALPLPANAAGVPCRLEVIVSDGPFSLMKSILLYLHLVQGHQKCSLLTLAQWSQHDVSTRRETRTLHAIPHVDAVERENCTEAAQGVRSSEKRALSFVNKKLLTH